MATVPQDDIEALDRGLVENGLTLAQAMARIEALELQFGALRDGLVGIFAATGRPVPPSLQKPAPPPRRRHVPYLTAVPPVA